MHWSPSFQSVRSWVSPSLAVLVSCAQVQMAPSTCPDTAAPPTTSPVKAAEPAVVAAKPPEPTAETSLRPSTPDPWVDDGNLESLKAALAESLSWLASQDPARPLVFGPSQVTVGELSEAFRELRDRLEAGLDASQLHGWLTERFELLESVGGPEGKVMFTGYYEPVLKASLVRDESHRAPIYGLPEDLVEVPLEKFSEKLKGERVFGRLDGRKLLPYPTRKEIDEGYLSGRNLELAWAESPVDLFFVEVQGSATVLLPDGQEKRIGYAGANGRAYKSIGASLIEAGAIPREKMSMQALKAWLAEHPEDVTRTLEVNESFVFFRWLDGAPLGALGRPVTPGRSIATDLRIFPKAAMALLVTDHPVRNADGTVEWKPLVRLVFNQDTGGAIRGPGRVDVFWGRGPEAELAAGMMKQMGRLFFLKPRPRS